MQTPSFHRVRLVHVMTSPLSLGFFAGQVAFMKQRGLDITMVASPGEELDKFGTEECVSVEAVEMPRRITPAGDAIAVAHLYRQFRKIRPTIVHAHTPKGGLLGTVAAWLARVPVRIYHVRGLPFMTATGGRRLLLRLTEKISCALAHEVLCVSASIRDVAVAEGLCRSTKIRVLGNGSGNGVDAIDHFDPQRLASQREQTRANHGIPSGALVAGFVGRIVRDKGLSELVESWAELRREFDQLHLLLVGSFEPRDPVPDDVSDVLRSDPRVHLAGPQRDPAPFYAAMDLVVLPTYREGFPNVPLEAAAMAIPVVATQIPGCIDAVQDGVTGTLVPAHDAVSLGSAIRSYLVDAQLRTRHGRAGRERVLLDFRPQTVWEALYEHYDRLLTAARSAGTRGASSDKSQRARVSSHAA
jgi:glycosyltransferase involved in cell wall biosynthesis